VCTAVRLAFGPERAQDQSMTLGERALRAAELCEGRRAWAPRRGRRNLIVAFLTSAGDRLCWSIIKLQHYVDFKSEIRPDGNSARSLRKIG